MSLSRSWRIAAFSVALLGCVPARDWREVRPEGAGLVALFPCRPQHHMRTVGLPEVVAPMQLLVCTGGPETYAVGFLDVTEPPQVSIAMVALRRGAALNMAATELSAAMLHVPGMTPNPQAVLVSLRGHAPNGALLRSRVAIFAKGLRVYQATVFGAELNAEASETFFAGLKLL